MSFVVLSIGVLTIVTAIAAIVFPNKLRHIAEHFTMGHSLYYAALIRVVLGVLLIFAASSTRLPQLTTGLGVFLIVAGAAILMIGIKRMIRFAYWWLAKPNFVLQLGGVVAVGFGSLLVWLAV